MNSKPSFLRRLFGTLWAVIDGLFKLTIVVSTLLLIVGVWVAVHGGAPPKMEDNMALVIYPTGELVESTDQDTAQRFLQELSGQEPAQTQLRNLTDALEKGAKDSRVSVAVLKLDDMKGGGIAQMQELATAVKTFRAAGKQVYAYGPYYEQADYLVASQADSISLDPMGMVMIDGFDVYQNYFKEALDKLGVDVHVFRVGEYKSAVEPFERNDMSAAAREADKDWLGDLWESYGRDVALARQLPPTSIDAYATTLAAALKKNGDAAEVAKEAKLVDAIETQQEFRARVAAKVGWDESHGTFRQINQRDYLAVLAREKGAKVAGDAKTIALVAVQGEIVDGDSEPGLAGADSVTDLLVRAREDENVAAVVLRIDSPGGSVFASERIRRELQALQAQGKPVVASMSNVAASGGYWVAMDADEIWAHDTTITGSIGIFGLIPTFDKPLAKLGIHTDGIGTTPLAGAMRGDRPLGPEAAQLIQSQIEQGYKAFIDGVSGARDLPLPKVQEIARGRVWSGTDALALGLVDQLGGLNDAVASAVRLAGLEPGAYRLEEFKEEDTFHFGQMLDLGDARTQILARMLGPIAPLTPVERIARSLRWLNDPRGVYAHCFCTPSIGRP